LHDCKLGLDCKLSLALCIRRTLCRHVTIGTPTNGHFCCFDCLLTDRHMLPWYTVPIVKQSKPLVYQSSQVYQDCTNSVVVYQSSKTVKNSQKTVKTATMTIGVPIVTCLPRLYEQCTNRQKQSKQQKLPLVYQSSHVYTESAEYTKSASASAVRIRVHRIHKAT